MYTLYMIRALFLSFLKRSILSTFFQGSLVTVAAKYFGNSLSSGRFFSSSFLIRAWYFLDSSFNHSFADLTESWSLDIILMEHRFIKVEVGIMGIFASILNPNLGEVEDIKEGFEIS
jgi:hypothetical protein